MLFGVRNGNRHSIVINILSICPFDRFLNKYCSNKNPDSDYNLDIVASNKFDKARWCLPLN